MMAWVSLKASNRNDTWAHFVGGIVPDSVNILFVCHLCNETDSKFELAGGMKEGCQPCVRDCRRGAWQRRRKYNKTQIAICTYTK